jgi:PPOX class probable F420-dependent enzyme
MSSPARVCVIGAGMSGLAATHALTRAGCEVTGYEAGSAVGGMWRYENDSGRSAAYASLHTNTSRQRMQYPSMPMPDSVPEFPHHTHMLAYLEEYAEHNDLARHVRFGTPVRAVRRVTDGGPGSWQVLAGGDAPRRFDWVVVATGHYSEPALPELPGEFAGEVLHVRDYRAPDRYAGRRVVVVGGAQSALDIVAEISTTAEHTILACDQVHHLLPRRVLGRPFDAFDNAGALLVALPLVRLGMAAMMRVGGAVPDRGNLAAPRHRLFETRWPAVVSPAAAQALAAGTFEMRPRVSALDGAEIVFGDGSRTPADALVFATGYRIGFPFLDRDLGRGQGWEFPLFRRILSPYAPGLAFVGLLEPGPGLFEIVERQSEWLAAVIAGSLRAPDQRAMWNTIDAGGERRSRRQFRDTGRHTILCNRHAYLRTLANDLRRARRAARTVTPEGDSPSLGGARASARARPGRRLPAALSSARLQARLLRRAAREQAQAPATGTPAALARGRYTLVTTFRRDGTPVATPVWAALEQGRIYVRAERSSGKVKRLLRDPRALVAPCTTSGRPRGAPLSARGRVLEPREEFIAERALARRYGLGRVLFEGTLDLLAIDMCYLELTPNGGVHESIDGDTRGTVRPKSS